MNPPPLTLHELFLASLGGDGHVPPPMAVALIASFGTVQRWRDEFVELACARAGSRGWVLLGYLPGQGRLVNEWLAGPGPAPARCATILALGVNQRSGPLDPGADAAASADAFMAQVNWAAVAERYAQAVHAASGSLGVNQEALASAVLLDVRRDAVFASAETLLPGASWRDPANIAQWMHELPRDREIVVYCVYGHEVGRGTALRLRAEGFNARFLEGGIDTWAAQGRPLQTKQRA